MWLCQKGGWWCSDGRMGPFPGKWSFISKHNSTVIENQQNQNLNATEAQIYRFCQLYYKSQNSFILQYSCLYGSNQKSLPIKQETWQSLRIIHTNLIGQCPVWHSNAALENNRWGIRLGRQWSCL
jgi:hypothetical protein